ncbi:hypothetical protein AMJ85_02255 [candidate division BRC1 bacterium SM23_51]|nr:MAG: hypothetical protein AMJ85_02255 [candidate division BRC1 bacterium SM23_51]
MHLAATAHRETVRRLRSSRAHRSRAICRPAPPPTEAIRHTRDSAPECRPGIANGRKGAKGCRPTEDQPQGATPHSPG